MTVILKAINIQLRYLIPQQIKPMSAMLIDGGGEYYLTDKIEKSTGGVNRKQYAKDS